MNFYLKLLHFSLLSTLAGCLIGLGGYVSLSVGKPLGPFLFSIGILLVIFYQLNLYTGKLSSLPFTTLTTSFRSSISLLVMFLFNMFGTWLISLIATPDIIYNSFSIVKIGFSQSFLHVLLLSIPTGFLMTSAVRAKDTIITILCVSTFIFCGLHHSVADTFYMHCTHQYSIIYIFATVIGNFIGGRIPNLLVKTTFQRIT